ncbi:RHS domain-containing protein [Serratia rubidaea]|nr:RHS domain-containing protein [Serratia rubidaea]
MHSDQNGAPLEVTDAGGQLCWSGNYDTFGKLQGQTAAGIMQRRGAVYERPPLSDNRLKHRQQLFYRYDIWSEPDIRSTAGWHQRRNRA